MLVVATILSTLALLVDLESKIIDFATLTCNPETVGKYVEILATSLAWDLVALENNKTSSAKKR